MKKALGRGCCRADRRGRGGGLLVRHEIQACVYEQFHDARADRADGQLAAVAASRDSNPERGLQRTDLSRGRPAGVGQIAEFKPIIGYLALNQKIGILPIYIWGTYQAFPKGTIIPKGSSIGAKVGAKVGRFLEYRRAATR